MLNTRNQHQLHFDSILLILNLFVMVINYLLYLLFVLLGYMGINIVTIIILSCIVSGNICPTRRDVHSRGFMAEKWGIISISGVFMGAPVHPACNNIDIGLIGPLNKKGSAMSTWDWLKVLICSFWHDRWKCCIGHSLLISSQAYLWQVFLCVWRDWSQPVGKYKIQSGGKMKGKSIFCVFSLCSAFFLHISWSTMPNINRPWP